MSVQRGPGVTYIFYDAVERDLENSASWTDTRRKVGEVTEDVKKLAERLAPRGRQRFDQVAKIASSHYRAPGITKRGKWYSQVVGNRAPHAYYVHEGTEAATGREIQNNGRWFGPVWQGGGQGEVTLAGPRPGRDSEVRSSRDGRSRWRTHPGYVYFDRYVFRGQLANPWLARAGQLAYRMPRNH